MNIFIDTNIYLNFYDLSNEDLAELNKISVLQSNKEIFIFLPEQIEHEFRRNRESKIKIALQQFKEDNIKNERIPNMAKTYPEYESLILAKNDYLKMKSKIIEQMEVDIFNETLPADKLILSIFEKAVKIPLTEPIFQNAQRRHFLGNPPGKKDSLGDAVNWESLISEFSTSAHMNDTDLHIIAVDGDYQSQLNYQTEKIKHYLSFEWKSKLQGDLRLYKRLSAFTREYFPDINIQLESEKLLIIESFIESNSFSNTHKAVDDLTKFQNFSKHQVNRMLDAITDNRQITWILEDEDVFDFAIGLTDKYRDEIGYGVLIDVLQLLLSVAPDDSRRTRVEELIQTTLNPLPF